MSKVLERKSEHLELCASADVEASVSTLLDDVRLIHEALPELSWDEIDTSARMFGRQLRAPVLIAGMSGGTEEAGELNRALAITAERVGLGMGVGSQRAMLDEPSLARTFRVRDVAPDILLCGNIGVVQARHAGAGRVSELVRAIEADALCVHLNAAQELVQDEGDRDFRGALETLAELAAVLPVPVIAKETGCGLSPRTLDRLSAAGIEWVDVAGCGGTSWTAVESLRGSRRQQALGRSLREWGVPTAASVVYAARRGLHSIASGGIRTALDAARALALGADAVSLALPFLRAYVQGGVQATVEAAATLVEGMTAVLLLTGCRGIAELRRAPRVIGPDLRAWIEIAEAPPGIEVAGGPFERTTRTVAPPPYPTPPEPH